MTKASDNLFPKLIIQEAANDGSDFSNPSADYRVLFLGEDGYLHVKDSSGTVTDPYNVAGGGEALANVFVGVGHPMLHSAINQALAANRIYLARFSPLVDVTVTTANLYINTSAGNLDFGIYSADLSTLHASVGTTASPGTGHRTFAFSGAASVALDAGTVYYLAMQASSTSLRCPVWVPAGAFTTGWQVLGREDTGGLPLPSSIAAVDAWEDGFVFPLFYFT